MFRAIILTTFLTERLRATGLSGLGLGFRVWGLGFRVWGLGFRVWVLGFGF